MVEECKPETDKISYSIDLYSFFIVASVKNTLIVKILVVCDNR